MGTWLSFFLATPMCLRCCDREGNRLRRSLTTPVMPPPSTAEIRWRLRPAELGLSCGSNDGTAISRLPAQGGPPGGAVPPLAGDAAAVNPGPGAILPAESPDPRSHRVQFNFLSQS